MKLYSAMVKDGKRTVVIENMEYNSKKEFAHDLRKNGYKVNEKKIKPADVFDYIVNHTNMHDWDWEIKSVPEF